MRVVPAAPDLVRFLAARIGAEDHVQLDQCGSEAVLQSLESLVGSAARSWCGIDAGGPVLLLIATRLADLPGVILWFIRSAAVSQNKRACVVLWRRAVAEMLAEHGAVQVQVPCWIPDVRRLHRYGFAVEVLSASAGATMPMCRGQLREAVHG